jgi:CDP-4-dehydro-6-deoxyglucose reductase/ferredoxin-NAD(P)+ reductase (naphthalene dioxygenase ferredoxin-specific)
VSATIRVLGEPPREAPAVQGETILASLLQAGVAFPHNCQSGNCGACKCELIEGDILELPYSEYALSPEERAQNLILACRTQVWGDCVVRPLELEDAVLHPSRVMRCRVAGMNELTHDIKELKLAIEAGGPYGFTAGQHARLKFGPGIPERNYSMANRPDSDLLEFHVRQVPRGQASGYVFSNLHVGDEVTVSGPLGNAYLREKHAGPVLAVAGGSGMAPIKSIVETALASDPERQILLYFGVRDERDVYLEARLAELAQLHPRFSVNVVLSQPGRGSARRAGLVGDAVLADIAAFDGFKAYLAGPPPMVEGLQRALEDRGMARRDIHADAFYGEGEDAFNLV